MSLGWFNSSLRNVLLGSPDVHNLSVSLSLIIVIQSNLLALTYIGIQPKDMRLRLRGWNSDGWRGWESGGRRLLSVLHKSHWSTRLNVSVSLGSDQGKDFCGGASEWRRSSNQFVVALPRWAALPCSDQNRIWLSITDGDECPWFVLEIYMFTPHPPPTEEQNNTRHEVFCLEAEGITNIHDWWLFTRAAPSTGRFIYWIHPALVLRASTRIKEGLRRDVWISKLNISSSFDPVPKSRIIIHYLSVE